MAQETQLQPLTPEEQQRALNIEKLALPELQQAVTQRPLTSMFAVRISSLIDKPAVIENRQMQPDITILRAPGLMAPNTPRRAVVNRYDYGTGQSVSTVVDLDSNKVLDVRSTFDRPVPLDKAELERAVSLASERVPAIKEANSPGSRNQGQFEILLPVDGRRASPRFGHRLVLLWVNTAEPSPKALVDLTTDEVVEVS